MFNWLISNSGNAAGKWSLLRRIIWLKATVLSASGAAWETLSGAIVSFIAPKAHALKQVVVDINPVQDLHGYDSPWPEGGGVNKLPPAASFEPIVVGDATLTPYADGHYHLSKVAGSNPSSFIVNLAKSVDVTTSQYIRYISTGNSGNMIANLRDGNGNTLNGGYWGKPSANISNAGTATNFNFYFTSSVAGEYDLYPIISNSPVDTYSPYSNICPISGWTGCEIDVVGTNLFDKTTITDNAYINGVGAVIPNSEFFCSDYISVKPETEYYIFTEINGRMDTIRFYNTNKEVIGGSAYQKRVVTTPANCAYIRINAIKSHISANEVFFNYPSTDTEYHAYQGSSYSVTWEDEAGTVYGGTVDVVSGLLTIDRGSYTFVGNEAFELIQNDQVEVFDFFALRYSNFTNRIQNWNVLNDATMSCYPVENRVLYWYSGGVGKDNCAWTVKNYAGLCIRNDSIATTEALKSSLIGQTICYKLSTPITIQLTPQQVTALKGYNAVWSDAGPVEVVAYGTPIEEPDVEPLGALGLLLGGAYRNDHTPDDVSDEEALDIVLGGADR